MAKAKFFFTKDGVWTTQDGGSYEWLRQTDGGCRFKVGVKQLPREA